MSTLAQHDFSKTIEKKFYYSEIFYSIQGEGHYTGVPTAWIRFFLCNLQCNGFGQLDPTNPDTYDLPFQDFDVKSEEKDHKEELIMIIFSDLLLSMEDEVFLSIVLM